MNQSIKYMKKQKVYNDETLSRTTLLKLVHWRLWSHNPSTSINTWSVSKEVFTGLIEKWIPIYIPSGFNLTTLKVSLTALENRILLRLVCQKMKVIIYLIQITLNWIEL